VEVLRAAVWRLHRLSDVHVVVSAEWVYCLPPTKWFAPSFLTAYAGIPIFVVIYLAHRVVFRHDKRVWDPEEVDMQTGLEEVTECEKPLEKRKGWKKIFMVIE
jgi:amino acid transporter